MQTYLFQEQKVWLKFQYSGRAQTYVIAALAKTDDFTSVMTAMGVLPAALATLCSMRKNMYSSYSSRMRWKEPKLAALRSVRSRITMELNRKRIKVIFLACEVHSSDLSLTMLLPHRCRPRKTRAR